MDFTILECRKFVAPCKRTTPRLVHNHEFDFYVKGKRTVYIDERAYEIEEGSVTFRRPGQTGWSTGDFDCYILTLDFSGTTPTGHYVRNTSTVMEPCVNNVLLAALPEAFVPQHSHELLTLVVELAQQTDFASQKAHLLTEEILFLLNADARRKESVDYSPIFTVADDVARYLNQNFHKPIRLTELACLVHLDKSYLVRLFKKQFHVTPIEYLIERRLQHACYLLANTDLGINKIADACGYGTSAFFITQFKERFLITPNAYRGTHSGTGGHI